LQTIVSRSLSPVDRAVVTVGRFQAGTASNIIPEEAFLHGTLRTLSESARQVAIERLTALVDALEAAFGVRGQVEVSGGYPLLCNDEGLVDYCRKRAAALLGSDGVHLEEVRMGAEDFAFFLKHWPGVLLRIGCHDPAQGYTHGLHSPHFTLDERVLELAVTLFSDLLASFPEAGIREMSNPVGREND
jgi:amidohydrolase